MLLYCYASYKNACLLALRMILLGLLAGQSHHEPPGYVKLHEENGSFLNIKKKIRYCMKTHRRPFSACFPHLVDIQITLKPAGLPKPHVLRCRNAIKQSIANAQFDSFSLF